MRPERFTAKGLWVERHLDRYNGETFRAWKPHVSMWFSDRKALLSFIGWPKSTPTGESFRCWLNSFDDRQPLPRDQQSPAPSTPEHWATGFGPECHLDESDPNHQTRMVI